MNILFEVFCIDNMNFQHVRLICIEKLRVLKEQERTVGARAAHRLK